ncbi:HK97 gp10 family phage protein [Propionispira raffinosivorans]|uniref:HK97 gp10 family phage protein n=1 Tax=Propionispira raffinosivorans TaxID=86959 RepID=UPI0003672CDC|nr:HK97 gp10 family phage protein [Propionispira raffinosivorans]
MGKSDFSQLKAFQKRLEKAANGQQKQQFYEDCARELAARFLAKVIKRTPVGKGTFETVVLGNGKNKQKRISQGGVLRRGWTAKTEAEAESGGTVNSLQYAQSLKVDKVGRNYQITITNPVSYASYVEFGHRQEPGRFVQAIGKRLKAGWVKGQFMMTISEKELQSQAPGIIKRKFEVFLREVLDGK